MLEMVLANEKGQVREYPGWAMTGRLVTQLVEPTKEEVIPLPAGATLTLLPHRHPVGIDPAGQFKAVEADPFDPRLKSALAVGALLPQGYTRTLVPAYIRPQVADPLPLFGYAAVGFKEGRFWVAAQQTDDDHRWNPSYYQTPELASRLTERLAAYPENRLLRHLARCAREYSCFTAQNIFYRRWEAGAPFSPACNARCVGCISEQAAECCPAPQMRISFRPSVQEVVEIAIPHLREAEDAIFSFGQGCEGEPSLRAEELAVALKEIRQQTDRGTLNLNSNAGRPGAIELLSQAGLNALRVSLISANAELYDHYHRPQGYGLNEVKESIQRAVNTGVYVSLNLLLFPGVTDREEELTALLDLVQETGLAMIQLRNLNIDPEIFLSLTPPSQGASLGIPAFLQVLKQELPGVIVGNYSRTVGGPPKMEP
ncbi:MAG: radical SAM protein [Syntrophomonadaceae bacterium]|nr:radical SAM protein [Syntrophomonadaceae bacterium]